MEVEVADQITPTFDQVGPYCKNAVAPALPTTSKNNITGTWDKAINTSTIGKTTYTFTPAAGQCATVVTMEVEVADQITPTFDQVGPYCKDAVAPALPTTSKNNITGTWDKAINTSTVGKTLYTFTPAAGQCATVVTMEVEVADQITPTFDQVGPYCKNAVAPALPTTSKNNITGTWDKAINTSTIGKTTYTFTPAAGQCATVVTMEVEVQNCCDVEIIATAPDVKCGEKNAIITAKASKGTAPYQFAIDGGAYQADNTFDVTAGTYKLLVKDANGCTAETTVIVKEITVDISISEMITTASCGENNGSINISIGGTGASPYTYKWNGPNNFSSQSEDINGIEAGDYTIEVTDANGCRITKTIKVDNTNALITIAEVITDATCTGKYGAINITVSGTGTVPYTFKWTGPGVNATSEDLPALDAGDYTVEVTDAKGCKATKNIKVNNTSATITITETVTDATCKGKDGAINITVSGTGTIPYTYNWSGPNNYSSSNEDLTGIEAGNYNVEVTDANGCKSNRTITVADISNNILLSATAPDISCTQTTGTITVIASGGISPYSYTINGGPAQAYNTFSNLIAESYKINVKDANGCTSDLDIILKQLPSDLKATAVAPDISCNASDGTITVNATGGTAPYNYNINGGAYQSNALFTGLKAGLSKISVKDAGGCIAELYVAIKEQCCTVLIALSATDITCAQNNSTITVTATNGTAPYQYSLDGGNYQAGNTFSVSNPGDYKVTVKDSKDCLVEAMVTVNQTISDLSVITTAPDINCSQATGSITATAIKGKSPHLYSINGGPYQPGNSFNNLPAGFYNIAVKDASGCIATTSSQLKQISTNPNLIITDPGAVCSPGVVDITASSVTAGSDAGLSLTYWTNPSASTAIADPTAIVTGGTYYIKATDISGCSDIKAVKVTILNNPKLLVNDPKPSCSSVDITAAQITAGSDPDLSLSYWKDASATDPLPNPASINVSGTYYIKAGPAQCFSIKPVNVSVIAAPKLIVNSPAPKCAPAFLDITVAAVTAGSDAGLSLTYWSDAQATKTLANPNNISNSGTYYIRGASPTGCASVLPITIQINDKPNFIVNAPVTSCTPVNADLTAPSVTAGSEQGLSFTYWNDAAATKTLTNPNSIKQSGTYYIKASSVAGCTDLKPVKLDILPEPIMIVKDPSPVCSPLTIDLTDAATVRGSDNDLTYTYWKDAGGTVAAANPKAVAETGTYFIKGKASTGCTVIKPITLSVHPLPNLYTVDPPEVCTPNTVDLTVSGITAGSDAGLAYSYWRDANTSQALSNPNIIDKSGQYYIKASNSFGCVTTKMVRVNVNPLPSITMKAPDSLCIGLSTNIAVTFSGQAPWSFQYNDGAQSYFVNNITSMPYILKAEPRQTTTYTITTVSDRFCTNRNPENNKLTINIAYPLPGLRLKSVITTAFTDTELKARNIPSYTYTWEPRVGLNNYSTPTPLFNYGQQVEYKINMVSSAGCVTVDTMTVRVANQTNTDEPCDFFIPNVFSPNGDGRNDTYFPFTINMKEIKFFRIFNRWGELVYETRMFGEGWNGLYKGSPQPSDVYVWTAETVCFDGTVIRRSGNVLLLR
jgi:gliding motility-associated-like protein